MLTCNMYIILLRKVSFSISFLEFDKKKHKVDLLALTEAFNQTHGLHKQMELTQSSMELDELAP